MQACQYATFGDSSVLRVVEVDRPAPKPGCAVVKIAAAALNPVDYKVRPVCPRGSGEDGGRGGWVGRGEREWVRGCARRRRGRAAEARGASLLRVGDYLSRRPHAPPHPTPTPPRPATA